MALGKSKEFPRYRLRCLLYMKGAVLVSADGYVLPTFSCVQHHRKAAASATTKLPCLLQSTPLNILESCSSTNIGYHNLIEYYPHYLLCYTFLLCSLAVLYCAHVVLGRWPLRCDSYGWDNEYGSREFLVPAFEANKHMVSNGEYLEFVKDAGYARRELWTEAGWGWKMFRNVKCPKFWIPEVR